MSLFRRRGAAAAHAALQERLGYRFRDDSLLAQALVHPSYLNEHAGEFPHSNERLEFLGDAVVGAVAAQELYRRHPDREEGWLTEARSRLVRNSTLGRISRDLGVGAHLALGTGVDREGGRYSGGVLARALEAVIGAVWLDGGDGAARAVALRLLEPEFDQIERSEVVSSPKSALQEFTQASSGQTPRYETIGESGPPHDRSFVVQVLLGGDRLATGEGKSKRAAEAEAARRALDALETGGGGHAGGRPALEAC